MPALLIRISIAPKSARTSFTNCCACSKSAALLLYPFTFTPVDANSSSNASAALADELYVNATLAPCCANT